MAETKYVTTPVLRRMLRHAPLNAEVKLDPAGKHVLAMSFLHNDIEVRCLWIVKVVGTMLPLETYLTVTIEDFNEAMNKARVAT